MNERDTARLLQLLDNAANDTTSGEHALTYGDAWWSVNELMSVGLRIGQEDELESDDE